jgi:hypothetical protein
MSDELIEALAGRLAVVSGDPVPYDLRPFRRMARECLRQMEWARRHLIKATTVVDYTTRDAMLAIDYPSLTLAPPDWTP